MDDLAKITGFSKMTISRVFAGSANVRETTRAKVLAAAAKLGYEYNALAGNFASGRSGLIGVAVDVTALMGSAYFSSLFKGAHDVLANAGYRSVIFDVASEKFSDGERLAQLVARRRVEGLLAVVPPQNREEFLMSFSREHTSLVVVGGRCEEKEMLWLDFDNHHAVELLLRHLKNLGHRKVGWISGSPGVTDAIERSAAFHALRKSLKLQWRPDWEQCGDFSWGGGRRAMTQIMAGKNRPTAVVAANDFSALGACDVVRSMTLLPGRQISVAGIDGTVFAQDAEPALTTVSQPLEEMGRLAATILLERLRGERSETTSNGRLLQGSLLARASTGPAWKG